MACRICAAINGSGLNITGSGGGCDCSSDNTVTLTNNAAGAGGNVGITTTVKSSNFSFTGMGNGVAVDCANTVGCTSDDDCASGVCSLNQTCAGGTPCGTCSPPSCIDSKKNGNESDFNCGGRCPGCATGKLCIANNDCISLVCDNTVTNPSGTGTCKDASCSDRVLNGNETDVDCGGPDCTQCPPGKKCKGNTDCLPPGTTGSITSTTASGVCDLNAADAGFDTCLTADLLDVVVTGGGTVNSTSPPNTQSTGSIATCTSSSGTCLQSFADGATVTLTAISSATSGSITWTGTPAIACPACTLGGPGDLAGTTCSCTITLSTSTKVTVATPP
jgi:hypothetical protein